PTSRHNPAESGDGPLWAGTRGSIITSAALRPKPQPAYPVESPMPSPDWSARAEHLRLHANEHGRSRVRDALAGKVDLSGVVQETLLDADRAGELVPDADAEEELAWLRRAFANNLLDAVRQATAGRRDATRDVPLDAGSDSSSDPPSDQSTPSCQASR